MNFIKRVLFLAIFLIPFSELKANANNTNFKSPTFSTSKKKYKVSKKLFNNRWEANTLSIQATYNKDVKRFINRFLKKDRRGTELLLGRTSIYFPIFDKYTLELGLPQELRNISIIESALSPRIESPVGAKGLWQFMPATARMYGLVIDDYVDERCDPVKSTIAGLTYLKDLHEKYGDWKLAMAAYNCGPGRVDKSMKRAKKNTFEGIRKYLPKETKDYVAKFFAMTYVMENYFFHDLRPIYPEYTLQFCKTIKVYKRTSLTKIAKETKMSLKTIQKLNPSYRKGIIPPSADGNYIIIPIFGEEITTEL